FVSSVCGPRDLHSSPTRRSSDLLLRRLNEIPSDKRTAVRNNAGGHANHSLFWRVMAPAGKGGGGQPEGPLADAIKQAFGSFDDRSEEHTSELQSRENLVCRLLLE